jgi:hypothetical protein
MNVPDLMQPWWLIGLAAVPAIRWLHRHHHPLTWHAVSAVFLWQDAAVESTQNAARRPPDPAWRRRAFIAALIVTALAGPSLQLAQRSLTVWVDASPSMQTVEAGETRIASAMRLLDQALADHDFAEVTTKNLSAELPSALQDDSTHWLLSDGASESVRNWAVENTFERVIQVGSETENVAVTRLALRRGYLESDRVDVLVSIANTGTQSARRRVDLFHGDTRLATEHVTLPPGEIVHWSTTIPEGSKTLTATIDGLDALSSDDRLSIAGTRWRRLSTSVSSACGPALRAAIASHPALVTDGGTDLVVSCSKELPPVAGAASASGHAEIRVLDGPSSALGEPPFWMPGTTANGDLSIPTELIFAAGWPAPVDMAQRQAIFQSGDKALVTVARDSDGYPALVETVIDLEHERLAQQAEYAALVANLVDAATGRRLLDEATLASRKFADAIIAPAEIRAGAVSTGAVSRAAAVPVDRLLILIAAFVLVVDMLLLLAARRRASRA